MTGPAVSGTHLIVYGIPTGRMSPPVGAMIVLLPSARTLRRVVHCISTKSTSSGPRQLEDEIITILRLRASANYVQAFQILHVYVY